MKREAMGCVLAVLLLAVPAQAQETGGKESHFVVDREKANAGAKVFTAKACNACHTIGSGALAGPDLSRLLERRSEDWVRRWLTDPTPMFETDSTAKALLEEYNDLKMPNLKLSAEEIDQLLHYIADAGAKARKGKAGADQRRETP